MNYYNKIKNELINNEINRKVKNYSINKSDLNTYYNVGINENNFLTILDIEHNEKTTSKIIMKHIELFQKNEYSILFEFDKGTIGNFKMLKYTIDDMCCDYCYMGLVMDLFENEKVKSVKSNFDYNKPAFNIEFMIEFAEKYKEEELIEYIKEKYN